MPIVPIAVGIVLKKSQNYTFYGSRCHRGGIQAPIIINYLVTTYLHCNYVIICIIACHKELGMWIVDRAVFTAQLNKRRR